jgi:hypothetical protein
LQDSVCFFVFAIRVAATLVPFQQMEPSLLLGVVNGVLGSSVYPILGVALLVLAVLLEPGNPRSARLLARCRRFSCVTWLGFLLHLPVQFVAMVKIGARSEIPANRQISELSTIQAQIINSQSLDELQVALARLPGSPRLPAAFRRPLPEFRQEVSKKLRNSLSSLREQQLKARQQRHFIEALLYLQVVGLSLSFAWVFSAFSQWSPNSLSLIEGLRRRKLAALERKSVRQESKRATLREQKEARDQSLAMKRLGQRARHQAAVNMPAQQPKPGFIFSIGRRKPKVNSGMVETLGKDDPYLAKLLAMEEEGQEGGPVNQSASGNEAVDG